MAGGSFGKIIRGKSPIGGDTALKISYAFGIDINLLVKKLEIVDKEILHKAPRVVPIQGGETYRIMGRIAADDSMGTRCHFYDDIEHGNLCLPPKIFTFLVQGRSAEPVAWHGQYIMVDPHRDVQDKDLVVVRTKDGSGYFKRTYIVDGTYELHPISDREHHPAIRLHPDDIDFIAPAIGVVFENAAPPDESP